MSSDVLLGGCEPRRGRRRVPLQEKAQPPMVGLRFVGICVAVGALFAALGTWQVHVLFSTRDHEIETKRLQQLVQKRRDQANATLADVARLQRSELLRGEAAGVLGMVEPKPLEVDELVVTAESASRWQAAAEKVRREMPGKEVVLLRE